MVVKKILYLLPLLTLKLCLSLTNEQSESLTKRAKDLDTNSFEIELFRIKIHMLEKQIRDSGNVPKIIPKNQTDQIQKGANIREYRAIEQELKYIKHFSTISKIFAGIATFSGFGALISWHLGNEKFKKEQSKFVKLKNKLIKACALGSITSLSLYLFYRYKYQLIENERFILQELTQASQVAY
jgi:hypothetical protein